MRIIPKEAIINVTTINGENYYGNYINHENDIVYIYDSKKNIHILKFESINYYIDDNIKLNVNDILFDNVEVKPSVNV
jgi:hypothetical protein